jgi:hypothetical protein
MYDFLKGSYLNLSCSSHAFHICNVKKPPVDLVNHSTAALPQSACQPAFLSTGMWKLSIARAMYFCPNQMQYDIKLACILPAWKGSWYVVSNSAMD